MNPHLHGQFMTKEQEYTMGKRQPLQEVVLGKPDSTRKRTKADYSPTPPAKTSSERTRDLLSARSETIELLEENVGNTLFGTS